MQASNNDHYPAAVRPEDECGVIQMNSASHDQDQNETVIQVGNETLTFVAWDGDHSDGWDEQAIGVYNAEGKRIAILDRHAIGDVLDGIAASVNVELPEVQF